MDMQMLNLAEIASSPINPASRTKTDMEGLIESVRTHGVLQPVLVQTYRAPNGPFKYELIDGHRRMSAAAAAGLSTIPAVVRTGDGEQIAELQLIANLQRADLHPLDEAEGYGRLNRQPGYDVARIAARIGRSPAYVYDRLRLLQLTKQAQKLFREGRFTAGHAVLLARLTAADQARALDTGAAGVGGVFRAEQLLWNRSESADSDDETALTPRSVRELQGWIDKHVRFDPASNDVPALFPETAATVKAAKEEAEKIVAITHESFITDEARTDEKVIGPRSWKRADKPCPKQVTGVIVIGPGRGQAFKVCINKECKVHWAAELREKAQRAKASAAHAGGTAKMDGDAAALEAKRNAALAREAQLQASWKKAAPAIAAGLAARIIEMEIDAKSALTEVVIEECSRNGYGVRKELLTLVPIGPSIEQVVKHCAYRILVTELVSEYRGPEMAKDLKKSLGFDAMKLLDDLTPLAEKPAGAVTKAKPAKPPKKGGAR